MQDGGRMGGQAGRPARQQGCRESHTARTLKMGNDGRGQTGLYPHGLHSEQTPLWLNADFHAPRSQVL